MMGSARCGGRSPTEVIREARRTDARRERERRVSAGIMVEYRRRVVVMGGGLPRVRERGEKLVVKMCYRDIVAYRDTGIDGGLLQGRVRSSKVVAVRVKKATKKCVSGSEVARLGQ